MPNQNKHGESSVKAGQSDDLAVLLSAAKIGQQNTTSLTITWASSVPQVVPGTRTTLSLNWEKRN